MTKEEFRLRASRKDGWAPGWEAVEEAFASLYPGQEPARYLTPAKDRAASGGNQYLDGYNIYTSPKGYRHIVTFGLSELYADEDALGGEWSGWGYEMTFKLPAGEDRACMWALEVLSNLARYTCTQERYFEPAQFINGGGRPIRLHSDTAITSLLIVRDTELAGADTLYGRLDFLQLVGITQPETDALLDEPDRAADLVERLRRISPDLITDLSRAQSRMTPRARRS